MDEQPKEPNQPNVENTNAIIEHVNNSKKIRPCPHCGQRMEIKSPWKALWRMPSLNEWITLFMIIMMVFAAWAYKHDTQVCRDYANNIDAICIQRGSTLLNHSSWANPIVNLTNVTNIPNNEEIINETLNETTIEMNVSNETLNETNGTVPDLNVTLNETVQS